MFDTDKLQKLTDYFLNYIQTHKPENIPLEEAKKIYKDLVRIIN
jgi:hypothetical protein